MLASQGKQIGEDQGHLGGEFEFKEDPEFIHKRLDIYHRLKAKKDDSFVQSSFGDCF